MINLHFPLRQIGYWPLQLRLGCIVFVFGILFFGGMPLFLKAPFLSLHHLKAAQQNLKQQVTQQYIELKNIQVYQLQNLQLDTALNTPYPRFLNLEEAPNFINAILQEANSTGMKVQSFKRTALLSKKFYSEELIEIVLIGGYYDFALFCDALVSFKTIVTLSDLNMVAITNDPSATPDLSIHLTLHLYYLNPLLNNKAGTV